MRPYGRFFIAGSTAWTAWTTPMKLTSIIRPNNAASDFANGADSAMPAFAIRMSIGCRAAASAIAAVTAARSATSATPAKCAAPAATASSRVARSRPSTETVAPARASVDAISRPMPRPPPVTSACEERGSPDMRKLPSESNGVATCIYFKLQAFARNQLLLLDRSSAAGSVALINRRTGIMAALEKGITRNGTGYSGKTWNILGQVYFPKAVTDSTFAFETNSDPGQFVPVHIHPTQDEFILVQDGMLDLKLDGVWVKANAGDLVRLPRGIPHGYFNKSEKPARALFWVSPTQKLEALFNQLHNLTDVAEIVRISAEHEVNFLPPEANE